MGIFWLTVSKISPHECKRQCARFSNPLQGQTLRNKEAVHCIKIDHFENILFAASIKLGLFMKTLRFSAQELRF